MIKYRILDKNESEINEYHRLRYLLWPHHVEGELRDEMHKIIKGENFYKDEL